MKGKNKKKYQKKMTFLVPGMFFCVLLLALFWFIFFAFKKEHAQLVNI